MRDHVNAEFLVNFMRELLPKLVHHCNMLKLYHNLKAAFLENLECTYINIDFSENLMVGIKWEPQSLHWSKKQVTVHSGIVKVNGNKGYHPYVSNSRVHDQIFVKSALEEMIESTDGLNDSTTLVIESDNCSVQYKSARHFYHLQQLSNQTNKTIIRMYGIAGHGKGEVDHVGGVAKVAVRREMASGAVFRESSEIVDFLLQKFSSKESPRYIIKEISEKALSEARKKEERKTFETAGVSSKFMSIIFTPNSSKFKASPRLCKCLECDKSYGSC